MLENCQRDNSASCRWISVHNGLKSFDAFCACFRGFELIAKWFDHQILDVDDAWHDYQFLENQPREMCTVACFRLPLDLASIYPNKISLPLLKKELWYVDDASMKRWCFFAVTSRIYIGKCIFDHSNYSVSRDASFGTYDSSRNWISFFIDLGALGVILSWRPFWIRLPA